MFDQELQVGMSGPRGEHRVGIAAGIQGDIQQWLAGQSPQHHRKGLPDCCRVTVDHRAGQKTPQSVFPAVAVSGLGRQESPQHQLGPSCLHVDGHHQLKQFVLGLKLDVEFDA